MDIKNLKNKSIWIMEPSYRIEKEKIDAIEDLHSRKKVLHDAYRAQQVLLILSKVPWV